MVKENVTKQNLEVKTERERELNVRRVVEV